MGLLGKLFGTAVSTSVDNFIAPKVSTAINTVYDKTVTDIKIAKDIADYLLDKYGEETFYIDLDRFIEDNQLVKNLLLTVRNKSSIQPDNKAEFALENLEKFVGRYKKYKNKNVQKKQIYDIFSWMFDFVFSRVNFINPHTDAGKIRDEICRVDSASEWRDNQTHAQLNRIEQILDSGQSAFSTGAYVSYSDVEMTHSCPLEIEIIAKKIKGIETEYQKKNLFEEAISKYYELFQSINGLHNGQNAQYTDSLICSLNCNIALCQANLAQFDKATRSLESIPTVSAEHNKVYHFVFASVLIQQCDETKYTDIAKHLDRALELDSQYHRAFLLRQYLSALIGSEDCTTNIGSLNNHFSTVLSENIDQGLIADFYMNRGVIYLTYSEPELAEVDFRKAIEFGCNDIVSKLNLSASLYAQAVETLARDERFFYPNVDTSKIIAVISELLPIVKSATIDTINNKLIAGKVIELYVSACSIAGIGHGLTPLSKYLSMTNNYETRRSLILGSSEELSKAIIATLDESDQLLVHYKKLLSEEAFDDCKAGLEDLTDHRPEQMSAPLFHMLLQACIITKDIQAYFKYRPMASIHGVSGMLIDAMDACAFEIDGEIEKAKKLLEGISSSSQDYQLLENTLRFYKRNGFTVDCENLYSRIYELNKAGNILIENTDSFYSEAVSYLLSINSALSYRIIQEENSPINALHNVWRIKAAVYNKVNDIGALSICLENMYEEKNNFQDGFDFALCQKWLMRYDQALKICFDISNLSTSNENLAKLYWLISDLYLLKENLDDSYTWAQKAHELMIQNPYDSSHQALFGRALRCGHPEGFSEIVKYKNTHPVVLDWIQAFNIEEGDNAADSLLKQLKKFSPNADSYEEKEKEIASMYKSQVFPSNLLLEFYQHDLVRFINFAQRNKLKISSGNREELQKEEASITQHIVIDAQSLIVLSYFECLDALKPIDHLHVNYGSVITIQNYYLSSGLTCIFKLLRWLEASTNITFVMDGFIDEDNTMVKVLSRNFVVCCNIARENAIPQLYSDLDARICASTPELGCFTGNSFISIPAICNYFGKLDPSGRDQMLYRLLKGCTFVSFSASTIVEVINKNGNNVSNEIMSPFLICKSDYDMGSFANVYLQAIECLLRQDRDSAICLTYIIVNDTFRVWRRGTSCRLMAEEFKSPSEMARAVAISAYVNLIATSIERLPDLPHDLKLKCDELHTLVANG